MLTVQEVKYFTGANIYAATSALLIRFAASADAGSREMEQCFRQRLHAAGLSLASIEAQAADVQIALVAPLKLFAAALAEILAHGVVVNLRSKPQIIFLAASMDAFAITARNEKQIRKALGLILNLFNAEMGDCVQELERFKSAIAKKAHRPMLGVVLQAAEEKRIPWMWMEHVDCHQIGHGRHRNWADGTITGNLSVLGFEVSRRKSVTNRLLRSIAVPVPHAIPVASLPDAKSAAAKIGYPVVVKPLIGHKGIGITVGVDSTGQLAEAFAKAQEINPWVIVEKFIPGGDVRMLVVGRKLVAAASRQPPRVIGDGNSSIAKLIENENSRRSKSPGTALPIEIDDDVLNTLGTQGFGLNSVLNFQESAALRTVANWSQSGTSTDVTDIIHPDNADMAVRAALAVGIDVAGVDFITPDISRPYHEVGGAICEINYQPGLRVHLAADPEGRRDLGSPIIESMISGDGRIDVIFVVDAENSSLAEKLANRYAGAGQFAIVVDARNNGDDWHKRIEAAFSDPDCDALIVSSPSSTIVDQGSGVDYCRLVVRYENRDEVQADAMRVLQRIGDQEFLLAVGNSETIDQSLSRLACALNLDQKPGKQAKPPPKITTVRKLRTIAEKSGLAVKELSRWQDRPLLQFGQGATQATYRGARTGRTSFIATRIADDKQCTNAILQRHGLPHAPQAAARSLSAARTAANGLGYPVIVKPSDSSESRGVTGNILNDDDLVSAVEKALDYSGTVIIEPFLCGVDHRFLVIGGKMAHVTRHETAQIVGDGVMSVTEHIAKANENPLRGVEERQPYTLLSLEGDAERMLMRKGLTATSIPRNGQVVLLSSICSLSTGGTATDVTEIAHPDNIAAAEKAARIVGLDICGVDFLLPDVSKSYHETGGAILEVNQRPSFDMHDASTNSTNRIRSTILQDLLNVKADSQIPLLHCLLGNIELAEAVARSVLPRLRSALGLLGGVAVPEKGFAMIGSALITSGDNIVASLCNSILVDQRVQAAVFLTGSGAANGIPETANILDFRSPRYAHSAEAITDAIMQELLRPDA